ncbi:sigma 54-interacting transcriptional regulator [Variovorax sp. RA8]|uniref:sigma 54-interacting transcriptional regulator n=1 Tax=Variovorax sp. (strain JCM 16519 / RA8) TaxID=662548 RepID=UPI0013165BEB|nr:sigma 54-interacting transcriptional regulator [Variovorax sp. RA8]VTU28864.1 Transcriptional regulatory protein ZraR [Variovorax sp. RA8]
MDEGCSLEHAQARAGIVGASHSFKTAISLMMRYTSCNAPVLIVGESGTGKELVARATHYLGSRRDKPFIPVNCGALPDALIESELYGHARGAFTDASRARRGLVRQADGGTLFLDEVEALTPRGQVTLLRFLQDASFRPVGEDQVQHANVRVIAASNTDLRELVQRGDFRADLFFRLDVLRVELPPLRARPDDLDLLVPHLLKKAARTTGGPPRSMSRAGFELLRAFAWPGNVRELEHTLLRAYLSSSGLCIEADALLASAPALAHGDAAAAGTVVASCSSLREAKRSALRVIERRFVEEALAMTNGNISEAARLCDMQRASLSKLAKKYAIRWPVCSNAETTSREANP